MDVNVGDTITLNKMSVEQANHWGQRWNVPAGTGLSVTRVFETTLLARGPIGPGGIYRSARVSMNDIESVNGRRDSDAPRRLGEKPADTAYMHYIDVDHPGIQWLFEDMGKFADEQGYCDTYDTLCKRLGIPARPEEFDVEFSLNDGQGLPEVTVYSYGVRATSQEEADELVRRYLRGEQS